MRIMKKTALILAVLSLPLASIAKDKPRQQAPAAPAAAPAVLKTVTAVRAAEPIVIDGRLTESAWQCAPCDGFIQNDPQDGSPSTEQTHVWVAYDDKALYVAAYCFDSEPQKIVSRLGRRDSQVDSDWFLFAVDPYNDKRTGYIFGINPAGSVLDRVLSNDVNQDSSWDGIWEAKTEVNGQGWILEMRIPLNQLRFPKKDDYVWGVNFQRVIKRKNETSSYAWVPKTEPAFVSKFAELRGIQGIKPGRHIELQPYVVGQAQFRPAEEGNPFETGRRGLGNAGFDLKAGLKSNLTLDATVNPDFGQVEVDPAVLNLSAYETYYSEKRPFFIEGASIFNGFGRGGLYLNAGFNWPEPTFFYSRRIGRSPQGGVTENGYVRLPDRTTILGAAKLTGKLGTWNVGFVSALTSSEFAEIDQLGSRLKQEIEPFSFYGVFRAQKDVRKGRSGYGLMATGVMRDLESETLAGILNKNAFSLAVDGWHFLDEKRNWVVGGWLGGTRVEGSREDILRLQYSSMHYFQRPDADHIEVAPDATSLSGWGGKFTLAKQNGNWLGLFSLGALSPGFNPNDMGFQYSSSDIVNLQLLPGYQWTKPGKLFQYALVAAGYGRNSDFGGNKFWELWIGLFQAQFKNFWTTEIMLAYNPSSLSKTLTRGGPMVEIPTGYEVDLSLSSDSRKPVILSGYGMIYHRPGTSLEWSANFSLRWKPSPTVTLSVGPTLGFEDNPIQWVTRVSDEAMTSTYGRRYVFGRLNQKVIATDIRLDWTFTPKLTLQAYLQPFLAVGRYEEFKELACPRSYSWNVYGENGSTIDGADGAYVVDPDGAGPAAAFAFGNPDFNYKSLRGTVVLRWEYLPGSLLYFVWTQSRADFAHPGDFELRRDLGDLFTAPGDNIFLLKVSYRWNM
ncbi:MAG: carbohydrate binding family 9 domain-containing protein [Candidatus Aminicenantes bacterium]|nr:carbohydrate binding family 9 domain-containing protein [Candidatus Aminicenantes bacterium]